MDITYSHRDLRAILKKHLKNMVECAEYVADKREEI
jgi:hypothetical protein